MTTIEQGKRATPRKVCEKCFHWRLMAAFSGEAQVCKCNDSPRWMVQTGAAESCDAWRRR